MGDPIFVRPPGKDAKTLRAASPDMARRMVAEEAVDGVGLGGEPFRETRPEPFLRRGNGEIEPREMQDVVVVRQRRELHPPVGHELEERARRSR